MMIITVTILSVKKMTLFEMRYPTTSAFASARRDSFSYSPKPKKRGLIRSLSSLQLSKHTSKGIRKRRDTVTWFGFYSCCHFIF